MTIGHAQKKTRKLMMTNNQFFPHLSNWRNLSINDGSIGLISIICTSFSHNQRTFQRKRASNIEERKQGGVNCRPAPSFSTPSSAKTQDLDFWDYAQS